MAYTKLNRSAATLTKNRTEGSISPFSGMCVTCVDGCIGMCEIGKSAYRGPEVLYPQPFGIITAASEKEYPVDLSHFTILGTAAGAYGVEADSDKALFHNASCETEIAGIPLKVPILTGAFGSTEVARLNWDGLAVGAALSGAVITIGENVCGMDRESKIQDGKVVEYKVRKGQKNFEDIIKHASGKKTTIAELGIGTNPKAKPTGGMIIVDEKILGTIHLAIGQNKLYGGVNEATIHWDFFKTMGRGSRVFADGKILMKNGKWLL